MQVRQRKHTLAKRQRHQVRPFRNFNFSVAIERLERYLSSTRDEWVDRAKKAQESWPEDYDGGVMCGPAT